jgi:hypothetical protein
MYLARNVINLSVHSKLKNRSQLIYWWNTSKNRTFTYPIQSQELLTCSWCCWRLPGTYIHIKLWTHKGFLKDLNKQVFLLPCAGILHGKDQKFKHRWQVTATYLALTYCDHYRSQSKSPNHEVIDWFRNNPQFCDGIKYLSSPAAVLVTLTFNLTGNHITKTLKLILPYSEVTSLIKS